MSTRMWVLPLAVLGIGLCGWSSPDQQQPGKKVPAKLLQTQLKNARKTYQQIWKDQQFRSAESPYLWSRRWLEAERQLTDNKKDINAAVDGHLGRMRDLQQATDQLFQQKLVTEEQVYAAAYYVSEAEIWVAQVKD